MFLSSYYALFSIYPRDDPRPGEVEIDPNPDFATPIPCLRARHMRSLCIPCHRGGLSGALKKAWDSGPLWGVSS